MADVTKCRQWYELNLAALQLREVYRATGPIETVLGLFLWRIPGLLGVRMPAGLLFPEEVTLLWDVPRDEVEENEKLLDLGFEFLAAFELPEFSGDNLTTLYHDAERETYCEVVFSRARGESGGGIVFSSHFPGPSPLLAKTVRSWKVSPLERPEEFLAQCVPGSLEQAYQAHRRWLGELSQAPLPTSRDLFEKRNVEHHRMLGDRCVERGVWVEARPALVKSLLRQKRLKQARPN
jgi:hypothetical protein